MATMEQEERWRAWKSFSCPCPVSFLLEITFRSQSNPFRLNLRTTDYGFIYRSYCPLSPSLRRVPSRRRVDLHARRREPFFSLTATYYLSPSAGLTTPFYIRVGFRVSDNLSIPDVSRRYLKSMLPFRRKARPRLARGFRSVRDGFAKSFPARREFLCALDARNKMNKNVKITIFCSEL